MNTMIEKNPKLSILIPSYNHARFLPEAIESMLAQDFDDYELIIRDDASNDNTRDVLEHYAKLDSRIRFSINTVNAGMAQNWNLCLREAHGEYIKLFNSDDKLFTKDSLSKLVAMLDNNPSAAIACSARYVIDEDSNVLEYRDSIGTEGLHKGHDVILRCLCNTVNIIGEPAAVLFRKRDVNREFDTRFRQISDFVMWIHLLERGDLIHTKEPLNAWRSHPNQQTRRNAVHKIGEHEFYTFMIEYVDGPWIEARETRKIVFNQIFTIRRYGSQWGDAKALENRMMDKLGRRFYITYYLCFMLPHIAKKAISRSKRLARRILVKLFRNKFDRSAD